nr:MAG TPA: hypothetical protein [Caudoviricetes sp.]
MSSYLQYFNGLIILVLDYISEDSGFIDNRKIFSKLFLVTSNNLTIATILLTNQPKKKEPILPNQFLLACT